MLDSLTSSSLKQKLELPFSPIQELHSPLFAHQKIRLFIKRDDLLDTAISGNKWRKLKYNLLVAKEKNYSTLLSFGGAFSNHIVALAAAGQRFGFATIGIIRGEQKYEDNPSLSFARSCGMQLHFVTREKYRKKDTADFLDALIEQYGKFYLLPEGGSNSHALQGCAEIMTELAQQLDAVPDYVATACGTAGTLSGLLIAKHENTKILGVAALKNADFLNNAVRAFIQPFSIAEASGWSICDAYHFGGYAKYSAKLIDFIHTFGKDFNILLEPIYTGKLFYAIFDLLEQGYFPAGSKIVGIHTGGLQGLQGLPSDVRRKLLDF